MRKLIDSIFLILVLGFIVVVLLCSATFHGRTPMAIKFYNIGLASGLLACVYALSVMSLALKLRPLMVTYADFANLNTLLFMHATLFAICSRDGADVIAPFMIGCGAWIYFFEFYKKPQSAKSKHTLP